MQVRAQWSLLRLPSRSLFYAKIHNIFKSKPTFTKFSFKSKPTFTKILVQIQTNFYQILVQIQTNLLYFRHKSKQINTVDNLWISA